MKNIQIIDAADNCVYDIFAATDEEFGLLFPPDQNVAFIENICSRVEPVLLQQALTMLWTRRVLKCDAMGIHGLLFYGFAQKAIFYPTGRDEEAINPDGTPLR